MLLAHVSPPFIFNRVKELVNYFYKTLDNFYTLV
nr:MAG TPA: hypothetical protein [Caudoviricetes sp.]